MSSDDTTSWPRRVPIRSAPSGMRVVADQCRRPEQRDEVRRVVLGPAAIDVDRRQPRHDAVVQHRLEPEQHAEHPGDRAPPRDARRRDRLVRRPRPAAPARARPQASRARPAVMTASAKPPIAAVTRQRHRDRGGDRRAEHEPDRVGAGPERRPGGHLVAHDQREDRPGETHPEPDPERQPEHEQRTRARRAGAARTDDERQRTPPAPSAPRAAGPAPARAARRSPCTGRGSTLSSTGRRRARCRASPGCSAGAGRWR